MGAERKLQAGNEHLDNITDLRATLKSGAWMMLKETLPESVTEVEVDVAILVFEAGRVVAFGVRKSELARIMRQQGNSTFANNSMADYLELDGERIVQFDKAGEGTWPPFTPFTDQEKSDVVREVIRF